MKSFNNLTITVNVDGEERSSWANDMNAENYPRLPRLCRPTSSLYVAIGRVIEENPNYYDMSRPKFISLVMKESRGGCNPAIVSRVFDELLEDAGLEEINTLRINKF